MRKTITLLLTLISLGIQSQEIKFGKVSKQELEEKFYPQDSSANAVYLFKKRRTYYDFSKKDGFQVFTEIHKRIKIYTKEGQDYGNYIINYYRPETGKKERVSNIKGYTFNIVDGNIEKEKISKNNIFDEKKSKYRSVRKIVMPNVKKGSVLDIKYKIISPFSYSIRDVNYQYEIPLKKFEIKIEIPEYYNFNKQSKGYYNAKLKEERKNGKISFGYNNNIDFTTNVTTFTGKNVHALRNDEPYIGNAKNYRGGVVYEIATTKFPNSVVEVYTTSWEKVSKKIYQYASFGGELKKTGYFKKDLQKLLEGITSDQEKLIKIFQYVKSKVKWNDYYGKYSDEGVKKAYKEGIGNVADINLMLTAMLREAGLNANPVLTSTKNNGFPLFPTMDGFNYVISIVEFSNGSYVLLDATEPMSLPNILPTRVLNWKGRKVTKEGYSTWVNLTPRNKAIEDHKIYGRITQDNVVEAMMRSTYKNLNALNYRKLVSTSKNEEISNTLEENYGIEIENLKLNNIDNLTKPVGRNIKFISENVIEEINNKKYIKPLLFFTKDKNPFKLDERKYPIDFIAPWKDTHSVTLTLPEGYKVEKLPEAFAYGLPDNLGVFKYQVSLKGNKITVLSLLQINSSLIGSQYYAALKDFYAKVVAKQSEKIVLVKS